MAEALDRLTVLRHALGESGVLFRNRAALERHQDRLAAHHLRWVAAHSAFTASRFLGAGLALEQWRELPPVGKPEMMAQFDTLNTARLRLADVLAVARRAEDTRDFTPTLPTMRGPVTVGLSSGTGGNAGAFVVSRAERLQWAGVVLRHLLPAFPLGLLKKQRVAFLLRADGGLYRSVGSSRLDFRFLDLLRPQGELAAELSAYAPTLLIGPPSVLRALLDAGATARPERVVSVAEVLEDDDRAALERGFGPVVQVYQATEGLLGLPCPHGHLHLNEAHVHFDLEAVGDGYLRPVLTDLRRTTQPMVRHRLDDLLVLAEGCSCGLASRRVLRVAGRQDDALELPGSAGRVTVWPDFLRGAMNRVPGLREYRVEQTGAAALRVLLEPLNSELRQEACAQVRRALERSGADATGVQITVGPLPATPPGVKRRRVRRLWKGALP
ncbi:F390 synthetase-related protein [Deinococcus humi]|uniref:Putative adenylate-forming enzyme n=1 Tax=Deinococcus humi TaxID=662880 RepID=A0A7W8JSW8_9DEIO|nr:F390 synthetase-related protein [Deinococcus humi]MBB5362168.1 putative adenylate-forming enzyme [Deinococcus humi]GGO21753.1 adenylate synthase [Deinococcus humi]